jgi:hypothetical protein
MRSLVVVLVVAACAKQPASPPEVSPADAARGKAIIGDFKKSLVGALTRALADGVPQAIAVCNAEAPRLAAVASIEGAVVGRATRKPRNPANAAAGWQADALTQFEQLRDAKTPLEGKTFTRRLPDGRVAYAEPLVIQTMCLTCHGATLAPEVQATLADRYPDDRAIGYADGDLRGLAWVELPATK